jgi:hypothetical protein
MGQIIRENDIERADYMGRDAVTIIEGEFRQFERRTWDTIQRYVENLVTGSFLRVKQTVDLSVKRGTAEAQVVIGAKQIEVELL